MPVDVFEAAYLATVKSFLINTGITYSHLTLTPTEVIRRNFASHPEPTLAELETVDLLVLLFRGDPPHKLYPTLLHWLIEKRQRDHQKPTWVLTPLQIAGERFKTQYSAGLARYVETTFTHMAPVCLGSISPQS